MNFCGINQAQLQEDQYCCIMKANRIPSNVNKNYDSTMPTQRLLFERDVDSSLLAAKHRHKQKPSIRQKVSLNKIKSQNKSSNREPSNDINSKKNNHRMQNSFTVAPRTPTPPFKNHFQGIITQNLSINQSKNNPNHPAYSQQNLQKKSQNQANLTQAEYYGNNFVRGRREIQQKILNSKLLPQTQNQIKQKYNIGIKQTLQNKCVHLDDVRQKFICAKPQSYKIQSSKETEYKPVNDIQYTKYRNKNPVQFNYQYVNENTTDINSNNNNRISSKDFQYKNIQKSSQRSSKPESNYQQKINQQSNTSLNNRQIIFPPSPRPLQRKANTVMSMYDSQLILSKKTCGKETLIDLKQIGNPQKMTQSGKRIQESMIIMDFFNPQGKLKEFIEQDLHNKNRVSQIN